MGVDDTLARLVGTTNDSFAVGGPTGPKIKDDTDALAARNAADNAYEVMRAAGIGGSIADADVTSFRNLQGFCPDITFSFTGSSPPSPGDNPGEYGVCKSDGGAYTEGDIVFDATTSLVTVPEGLCSFLTTSIAVSGDLSLSQWAVYRRTAAGWHIVGDGAGAGAGVESNTLTYTDTTNKVAGPIGSTPTAISESLLWIGGLSHIYTTSFTLRNVLGGSAPGWYLCFATDSTAPGGGSFDGGSNPATGIDSILASGDVVQVNFQLA